MTRYTRANNATRRGPTDATPWSELKKDIVEGRGEKSTINRRNQQWKRTKQTRVRRTPDSLPYDKEERASATKAVDVQWHRKRDWKKRQFGRNTIEKKEDVDKVCEPVENKMEEGNQLGYMPLDDDIGELLKQTVMRCYHCQQEGHSFFDCPKSTEEKRICYKCGSAEHRQNECEVNTSGSLPYATCFFCGKKGHISTVCPQHDKRICFKCGQVGHMLRDCKVESSVTAFTRLPDDKASVEFEDEKDSKVVPPKKHKVVIFKG